MLGSRQASTHYIIKVTAASSSRPSPARSLTTNANVDTASTPQSPPRNDRNPLSPREGTPIIQPFAAASSSTPHQSIFSEQKGQPPHSIEINSSAKQATDKKSGCCLTPPWRWC